MAIAHPTQRFPRGPEDLTAEWLTYALRSSGALSLGEVVAVEYALVEYQGQASRVYGLTLQYRGSASPPPTKLIAKLPPLTTYQSDQEIWNGFVSEARFYQKNTRSPLPMPVCYYADVEPQAHQGFVLLLEDLRPLKPILYLEEEEQVLGGIDATMKSLARFHAHFWKKDQATQRRGVTPLYAPGTKAYIEYVKPATEACRARHQGLMPKSLIEYNEALARESPALARGFGLAPRTLIHGDVHPGQVMAGHPNRPAMLIDWAAVRSGMPATDVPTPIGPWGIPHEMRWAKLYHAELSQQLGRDHHWDWDSFYRFYRLSPPHLGVLLYCAAFMEQERLQQIVDNIPDRSWLERPTWQENFLLWNAQWIERHGSIDAVFELEALGQAALEDDGRYISTPNTSARADSSAKPSAAQEGEAARYMPPPTTSISSMPPPRASAPPPLLLVPRHARRPEKRFPTAAEDLTPRWLTHAFISSGAMADGEVTKVELELLEYQGQASRVYGLTLEYSGCDEPPPTRLIAKIPPEVSFQPAADQQKNFTCETSFYRHYGRDPLLPIPTCYFADVELHSNKGFVLLLDDLRPSIPLEYIADEQRFEEGMISTMKSVAALHARFWCRDALERQTWLNAGLFRGHKDTAAWLRGVIEQVRAKHSRRLPTVMQQYLDLLQMESEALLLGFRLFPRTLVHFDVHPRQVMFGSSHKAMLIDWAATSYGVPALDILFTVGPWAAAREELWLRTYYDALTAHLARDNQSWSWDDFTLCVRAHPPRLDITLYALAHMDDAQLDRIEATTLDRSWMPRPTWQHYAFDQMAEWMERHRTLEAFAEISARGEAVLRNRHG